MARAVEEAKRTVHRVLRCFGYDVVRFDEPFARLARLLAERGIRLALDVGANEGAYARALRDGGYVRRIVSFEPFSAAFDLLERAAAADRMWDCYRLAIGAARGSSELNVAGNSSSSSLLEMTSRHVEGAPESAYVARERVELASLDALRGELWPPGESTFLKLDVQGYEGAVLDGAQETLPDVNVLQTELSLVPLYEGQPLLPELAARLEQAGFELVSLEPVFRDPKSRQLLQVDGLFVRR